MILMLINGQAISNSLKGVSFAVKVDPLTKKIMSFSNDSENDEFLSIFDMQKIKSLLNRYIMDNWENLIS